MRPYPVIQYQVKTEPVLVEAEPVTESRWHVPWSEPSRRKPGLRAGAHPFEFRPIGTTFPEAVNAAMFAPAWSIPSRTLRGLRTSLQRDFTISPTALLISEAVLYDKWAFQWSIPSRSRALNRSHYQSWTAGTQPIPLTPSFQGYLIC